MGSSSPPARKRIEPQLHAISLLHVHDEDSRGFRKLSFDFKRTLTRNAIVSFHFDTTREARAGEDVSRLTDLDLLTHYKRLANRRRTISPTVEGLLTELARLGLCAERIDVLRRNLKAFAAQTGVKNFDAIAAHISAQDAMYYILRGMVYAGAALEMEEEDAVSPVKEHFFGDIASIPFKTAAPLGKTTLFPTDKVSVFKTPDELFASTLQGHNLLPHIMEGVVVGTTNSREVPSRWPTLARCSDFMTLPAKGSVFCGMSMWQYSDVSDCGDWRCSTIGKLVPHLYPGKALVYTTSREAALWFSGLYNAISFEDRLDTLDVVVEIEIAADTPFRLVKKGGVEDLTFVNVQRLRKRPRWDVPVVMSRFTPTWIELFGDESESVSDVPACSYQLAVIDESLVGPKHSVSNKFEARTAFVHSTERVTASENERPAETEEAVIGLAALFEFAETAPTRSIARLNSAELGNWQHVRIAKNEHQQQPEKEAILADIWQFSRMDLGGSAIETASNTSVEDEEEPTWTAARSHRDDEEFDTEEEDMTELESGPPEKTEKDTIGTECVWCQFEKQLPMCAFCMRK